METIQLTKEEWAEIFYAVDTKRDTVKYGLYGGSLDDKKWVATLEGILEKIGPDGKNAAELGISPTNK